MKNKAPFNLIGMFFLSQKERGRESIDQNVLGYAVIMSIPKEQWLNTLRFISYSCYIDQLAFVD